MITKGAWMSLRPVLLPLVTVLGTAAAAVFADLVDVSVVDPDWRQGVVVGLTGGAGVVGAAITLLAARRPSLAADAGAVAAGVLLAVAGTAALHGTRWGWFGLFADSSFRTQMATRYADSVALADYGYRDLPAYYPPALGWLQGQLAAVTDLAGWEAVKPVQIVVGALIPVLAYLLWRPVVGVLRAAAVAGLLTVWTAHPQKPDEWLVLACLLPWWLLTVRDVRSPGVDRWPAWGLGLILGLLLLTHTYWFLPFGLATLFAVGYDAARSFGARRTGRDAAPARLPWRRALVVGAVGLAVSAVFWVPGLLARMRLPSDNLQMRYAFPGGNEPPLPSVFDVPGIVGFIGIVWLAWSGWEWLRGRRASDCAGGLALALAGALATLGIGAVAQRFDVGLLAFKSREAVTFLLLVAGVLAVAELLRRISSWHRWAARLVPVAVITAAAATAGHHIATVWATGAPALVAQTTRYPDGSVPTGEPGSEPWIRTLFVHPADPSVAEIRAAWQSLRPDLPLSDAVVVATRVDLLATTPVHWFLATKSIYSHPNGRFEDRVALLRQVADCPSSTCAADLLQHNDLDPVDGLVLRREDDTLVLPFMVDTFPDRTRRDEVAFRDDLLSGAGFVRRELGSVVVIALAP